LSFLYPAFSTAAQAVWFALFSLPLYSLKALLKAAIQIFFACAGNALILSG
jgi:hypothetical protein